MNTLTNQLSILDIKVRDYLHIKKFRKQKRSIYDEQYLIKNKIPYFWLNASTHQGGRFPNSLRYLARARSKPTHGLM